MKLKVVGAILFVMLAATLAVPGADSPAPSAKPPAAVPVPKPSAEEPEINVEPVIAAAQAGDRYSQMAMGILYEQRESFTNAFRWFRMAADQDVPEAQFKVAFYYSTSRGVLRNFEEAAVWYLKAAQHGLPDAQYNIGVCFENGLGVAKSQSEALIWYRAAAESDNPSAQKALGALYERGKGIKADPVEAAVWYSIAESRGVADAAILKKRLLPMFTEEQLKAIAGKVKDTENKIAERRTIAIARAAAAASNAATAKPPGTNAPPSIKPKGKDFLD
ncbi:MAG TPA: tetratricopeptide repeat protein [Roseimicrobium sp.]|nr:tetratricopeptide repeat protein [Roseimicrobium sp.]